MKTLVLLLTILFSSSTFSNVIITGTRIIYPADADSITVQLTNNSKTSSLVQSWIDNGDENSTPENSEAPFYLSPPIVKIEGLQGQQLKIKKTPGKLSDNVESVFFLNVLDIPKTPESAKGKNVIQLATRSRIKIFYRPIGLTESSDEVINHASYQIKNNNILVKNNSQYHLTIAAITPSDDKNNSLIDSAMIAPMSEKELPIKGTMKSHDLILMYVDDYGVFKSKNIKL
ncbi:molecular chaperone [Providencia hangzhouensis]|uniref:Chaperone protein focC n=1 Tax=Providencia rettgeri TaxID=587 RepID=A0A9N8D2R7_PRORE|nr:MULTISPECIES: molecular chaperone [Providencia]MBN6367224.1 molecular chaperone [Providencia rettgeri]MBN7841985.1 molecular chaperone [Providencia rettgeri]MBN7855709.1 molecular chaperone [Providencia rettgeri]MBN7862317.1 molecular chaperone [Providencia rettgeri]MBN7872173.1 molecular chaperone [Providencia rettgeri]